MNKLLIALAAVTLGLPAVAGTAHDFDPSNVATRRSLDGQCYTTKGQSKVCFYRINGETFNVAVKDSDKPEFPHVFSIDCNTGQYKGFGPLSNEENQAMARAFCDTGRY